MTSEQAMDSSRWIPSAVIFDMDGLLVETAAFWFQAESDLLAARGHQYTQELRKHIVGLRMRDIAQFFLTWYPITEPVDALYDDLKARMVALVTAQVHPKRGADDLLAYLAAIRMPCAIASSSPPELIDAVVSACGWRDYFQSHSSGDEVQNGKPAPDIYLLAAGRLGVAAADCLALEDSLTGARASVAAGMTCYLVPDPNMVPITDSDAVTPYRFESLVEVLEALKG